ncbi:MAG: Fic family protein [bacterium]
MNQTPASNETKLGILNHEELNLNEALALKKTWELLNQSYDSALDQLLLQQAHKHGFDFLYPWAGKYRLSSPMLGELVLAEAYQVPSLMKLLFDDLNFRLSKLNHNDIKEVIKLISWFEHRFICIHPFANTNGRMGRLLSNLILVKLGYPPLKYTNRSENRDKYIAAMRAADRKNFLALESLIASELEEVIKE